MSNRNPAYTAVKTALLLHVPFFASLLLDIMEVQVGKFDHMFPPGQATMATDGRRIFIDEEFINKLPIEEAVFAVCHEVGHAMWEHMITVKRYIELGFDGQPFIPMLYNVAGDYVINSMLVKAGVGKMRYENGKPAWLLSDKYDDTWSVDDVYRDLIKEAKKNGQLDKNGMPNQGSGQGSGQAQPGPGPQGHGGMDVHIPADSTISSAEMKRAIQTAADTAKACGNLPGNLQRFAEAFLESKVSWQELLRTTVVTAASRDTSSWARPHRRRLAGQGVYLARPAAFGCDNVVVAVDTSGSIGQTELNVFFTELADIIRTCRPESTWVLGVDSRVASEVELPGDVDITQDPPEVGGGGGTDFRPAFEWVRERGLMPDAFVYFTDMMGPFPQEEPGYPVIWCSITPETQAPIGKTIYVDLK